MPKTKTTTPSTATAKIYSNFLVTDRGRLPLAVIEATDPFQAHAHARFKLIRPLVDERKLLHIQGYFVTLMREKQKVPDCQRFSADYFQALDEAAATTKH